MFFPMRFDRYGSFEIRMVGGGRFTILSPAFGGIRTLFGFCPRTTRSECLGKCNKEHHLTCEPVHKDPGGRKFREFHFSRSRSEMVEADPVRLTFRSRDYQVPVLPFQAEGYLSGFFSGAGEGRDHFLNP